MRHMPRYASSPMGGFVRRWSDQRGMTLVEILVVTAVVGILFAIALPAVNTHVARQELRGATREIVEVLRDARSAAVDEAEPRYVAFTPPRTYQVWRYDGGPWVPAERQVVLPSSVSFTTADVTFSNVALAGEPEATSAPVPNDAAYFDTRGAYPFHPSLPATYGFTLIELSVSLGLFAIVIVSLSLMFDRALSAGSRVRFDQVGKTLAQEKLEELRALPFYVPWTDEARRVDLLDWYFPDDASVTVITPNTTGAYDPTAGEWAFTTTETPLVVEGKDFIRSTTVQFVAVQDDGSIQARQPEAGYQTNVATADAPATQSVQVTVTVSWTSQGQNRSNSLDTIIHNIRRGVPNVEASGSVLAAQISGIEFHDGLLPDNGVTAEVLATVGEASTSFSGDTGSESVGLSADVLPSFNGVGAIAGWGSSNPSAATQARVSTLHTLNPEGSTVVNLNGFEINSREPNDGARPPTLVLRLGSVAGQVGQQSTTTDVRVNSSMALSTIPPDGAKPAVPAAAVWASRTIPLNSDYKGVVTIAGLEVNASASASATSADTAVDWRGGGGRGWGPGQPPPPLTDPPGGEKRALPVRFRSFCGGWEDDPSTPALEDPDAGRCGATRVNTSLAPGDNPVPGEIPAAYVGDDGSSLSLSIVAGVTVRDAQADPTIGSSTASIAQKNILSITTQETQGAVPLVPMLVGVGDASADTSYIVHEH